MAGDGKARIPETVICRLGEISPAAGRLYLWFCARRNDESGVWRCPLPKAAAALKMDVATAYSARRELLGYAIRGKERGRMVRSPWIELYDDDLTRPLVGYESANADNQTANADSGSANAGTQSANADKNSANADNQTANADSCISKDRARGFTPHLPPTLPPSSPPKTPTHTGAPSCAPSDPPPAGVGVGASLSFNRVKRYARNQSPPLNGGWIRVAMKNPSEPALVEQVEDWEREQARRGSPVAPVHGLDTSKCPDCEGKGMYYPEGREKGVRKCAHSRLFAAGDVSPPENAATAARSP